MKKTLIATTLALFASTSFANTAEPTLEQLLAEQAEVKTVQPVVVAPAVPAVAVLAPAEAPKPILPELPSPEAVLAEKTAEAATEEAKEPSVEDLLLNPGAEISKLNDEIFANPTERNLDRLTRATSFLKEEEVKTRILQERMRQVQIYRAENEAIIGEYERVKKVDAEKVEERKAEEARVVEQVQLEQQAQEQLKPTITDDVNVYSIYGQKGSLFAELVINGTKYQVQRGHKMEGFVVKEVTDTNVTLVKNEVEQSFTVSSKPSQFVSQEAAQPEQPVNTPNVIRPYELR